LQLIHLHTVTGIEVLTIIVRGKKDDGLKPVYYASDRARAFLESHIGVEAEEFISMMEEASINGATGAYEF
jgi:hypothetical protein